MGPRITTLCRTVKFVLDTATFRYFNLTAGECLRAENAKPAVIERAPTAKLIHGTQDRQSIVGLEMTAHCAVQLASATGRDLTIGREDDCLLGENPTPTGICGRSKRLATRKKNEESTSAP
jgi:hypothetical protein